MFTIVNEDIEKYCQTNTKAEPMLLQNLIKETYDTQDLPHMLTGRIEGRLLKMLVSISNAKEALEIGMFTGYSALSIAEALPNHGRLITTEILEKPASIAKKYFAKSPHGHKITVKMQKALDVISEIEHKLDFVFVDADKSNYINYFNAVLPKLNIGGLMVFDNMLWSGKVLKPSQKRDIILHELNELIASHPDVENVFLTVRDGVNIVRKIK